MARRLRFGLRHEVEAEDHSRVMEHLCYLSPALDDGGSRLRDIVSFEGTYRMYESFRGEYGRTPDAISTPIFAAIERAGRFVEWSVDLAYDFHADSVPEIFLPFRPRHTDGDLDARSRCVPGIGATTVQYTRAQSKFLAIDEESPLLARHGLSKQDAKRLNDLARTLEDIAMEHDLVMSCG